VSFLRSRMRAHSGGLSKRGGGSLFIGSIEILPLSICNRGVPISHKQSSSQHTKIEHWKLIHLNLQPWGAYKQCVIK
jgi:hypothetical protein